MMSQDYTIEYMRKALDLAKEAKGRTSPNPAVGAIIVKDGVIIGQGATQKAGCDHAEVVAVKQAGSKTPGSTLFCTLEPCCTYGRTPPCTNLIIQSKIKRVVIGVVDPNPNVNGSGVEQLRGAGIEIEQGFLEDEINELNEDFCKYIKTQMPFVIAKYAMTLDGKMATATGDSKWISNASSRRWVHELRNRVDAILVGVNTVINDNPQLNVRIENRIKDPLRIVLDSQGRTPLDSNVVIDELDTLFVFKGKNKTDIETQSSLLELCNVNKKKVLWDASVDEHISLTWLFKELGKMEISSVLVEGGSEVLASALNAKLIDKVACFVAPKIIMGRDSISPFGGTAFGDMKDALAISRITVRNMEDDILLIGYADYDSRS